MPSGFSGNACSGGTGKRPSLFVVFIAAGKRRIKLSGPSPCAGEDLPARRQTVM